jgi:ribonuclease BN (tRNA processing enzyme)
VHLTVIGCSGSFPGPASPASCYLLEADGFRLLIDLGSGAIGELQRHTGLYSIDAICLSHLHADHCLDLCPYWVARTYDPAGPHPPIPVYELAPGTREIGPFQVTTARMNHPVETFGFRVAGQGVSVAYSADTGETPALLQLAREADLLLCEASFLSAPELPKDLHLTGRQAAEQAARAAVGRLVLTHLVPWNDPAATLAEATAGPYRGPISLAAPGDRYHLR